jgi:3-hydroxyisobutyrate dehydrogenase
MSTLRVAFLGLGVMGSPMARHLSVAGHSVTVYNRTFSKAEAWVQAHGGALAATAGEAAAGQDVVLMCVGNDHDVRVVASEALANMAGGSVLVDHTTASATVAREIGELATQRNVGFLDAPVSGGQAGAENGALTIMCGGSSAHFAVAAPVMDAYAKATKLLGPVGSGQLTKMANQICIAGIVQGLAEAIAFTEHAGLDPREVIDAISKGAAQSWQMENRSATMHDRKFDFGFAVEWMRKDLGIVLDEARRNGSKVPVTALVDQFYSDVESMGGSRWDTSSLIARL